MKIVYFDNSATTKISERALSKLNEVAREHYGNPSSLHALGLDSEKRLSEARMIIAKSLGIERPSRGEIIFTSGGTESNNIAILGTALAKKRRGNEKILTTAGEHSSVSEPLAYLESIGFNVVRVPTKNGILDLDFIRENAGGTILATFMHVNNETGALYDIKNAFEIVKRLSPEAICHTDCVQSYLKVKFTKKSIGADLISISSHKVNGPKGVGALYISPELIKAKKIAPIMLGGGQEENLRSGTENVYSICAFGEAVGEHMEALLEDCEAMSSLKEYIIEGCEKIDGIRVNKPQTSAPHIVNITVKGIRSETLLHFLSSKGIYVSSGSACSSNSQKKISPALVGFGLDKDSIDSSVRISLCPQNTRDEAEMLFDALNEAINKLVRK
ncbi:MAG: cysteine desulfurase [Clostridia bacterium]|nr:cysteine desulfurase [Clostridia bacterium]